MRLGHQIARRFLSMSMGLYMCPVKSSQPIRWSLKVGLSFRPYNTLVCPFLIFSPVRRLSEGLEQVRDEQSYIVLRERTHRNTAESTNARVKWWSIFQLAVLIAEGVFQVWWLKRFFEVRYVFLCLSHLKSCILIISVPLQVKRVV
jgi:hypothetical protein